MGHWLKLCGIVIFIIGFILTATYDRPNCSGLACPLAFPVLELSEYHVKNGNNVDAYVLAFEGNCSDKAYEVISDNGHVRFHREGLVYVADRMEHFGIFYVSGCRGNLTVYVVNTYFSSLIPPNVTYDGNGGYLVFLSDYFAPFQEFYLKVSGLVMFNVSDTLTISQGEDFGTIETTYINGTLRVGDTLHRNYLRGILVKNGTRIRGMVIYNDPKGYMESKNCTEHYREMVKACRARGSPEYQLPAGVGLMVLALGLFWLGMKL